MKNWKRKVARTYHATIVILTGLFFLTLLVTPICYAWRDFGWKTLFVPAGIAVVIGAIWMWEWSSKQY